MADRKFEQIVKGQKKKKESFSSVIVPILSSRVSDIQNSPSVYQDLLPLY